MSAPLSVKLTCRSWQQLSAIHSRDLSRGAFFLKTKKPPPIGTAVRISLTLPSGSSIELSGAIDRLVAEGELNGRGPGIDIAIKALPQSVMWLIESALSSAGITPRPVPESSSDAPGKPTPPPKADEETPDLSDGDDWVEAEADLVKALWQELSSMSKMNAFQLLGVDYDASDKEVRTAFGALSKRYHPDRFTRYESFEIRELANEVFILLRDAYRKIADEPGRKSILASLDPTRAAASGRVATPPPPPSEARRTPPPPPSEARRTPPPPPPTGAVRTPPPIPPVRTPPPAPPVRTPAPPVQTPAPAVQTPPPPQATQAYSSPAAVEPTGRAQTASGDSGGNRVAMGMNVLESGQ